MQYRRRGWSRESSQTDIQIKRQRNKKEDNQHINDKRKIITALRTPRKTASCGTSINAKKRGLTLEKDEVNNIWK